MKFTIDGEFFDTLEEAEEYADDNDLDPNDIEEVGDEEQSKRFQDHRGSRGRQ